MVTLKDFHSKVKDLYIELQDYSFYHGPSEITNGDTRFVGRKNLINRLTSILSSNTSKTGAYLITGYRGMGKSSFVSKAISKVSSMQQKPNTWHFYIILIFLSLVSSILMYYAFINITYYQNRSPFEKGEYHGLLTALSLMGLFSLNYFFRSIKLPNKTTVFGEILNQIKKLPFLFKPLQTEKANEGFLRITKNIFLLSLVNFIATLIINYHWRQFNHLETPLLRSIGIYFYITVVPIILWMTVRFVLIIIKMLLHFFFSYTEKIFKFPFIIKFITQSNFIQLFIIEKLYVLFKTSSTSKINSILKKYLNYDPISKKIHDYFNYSKQIYIRINLGHDELKEIDILRLIARNIKTHYESYRMSFGKNFLQWTFLTTVILSITYFTLNNKSIVRVDNELKANIGFQSFFPTQLSGIIDNSTSSQFIPETIFSELYKSEHYSYPNYILSGIILDESINQYMPDTSKPYNISDSIKCITITANKINCLNKLLLKKGENKKGWKYQKHNEYAIIKILPKELPATIRNHTLINYDSIQNTDTSNIVTIEMTTWGDETEYTFNNNIHSIGPTITIPNSTHIASLKLLTQSEFTKRTTTVISSIDLFINIIWHHFANSVNKILLLNYKNFFSLPLHLNYFFILFFFIILGILRLITNKVNFLGPLSQRKIIKRLEHLNEIIDSQLTIESGAKAGIKVGKGFLDMFRRKNQHFPIADVREIEKWLIEILDEINNLPRYIIKPEFILIFDELDKIEPENTNNGDGEPVKSGFLFTNDAPRKRQQAIYKLLSNLKYFLTTAKAKFIFIAGREMYDAYLADVSDRNFFNRSIFNDVMYVQSFLTEGTEHLDNSCQIDISGLTEAYVCQFLLPKGSPVEDHHLKGYNKYLKDNFEEFNESNKECAERLIAIQKREKIIHFLHQFILYLMHSSNGAPKKIQSLFEKYIVKGDAEFFNKEKAQNILRVGHHKQSYYLKFTHKRQYKVGMISSLINPIIYSTATHNEAYEDKLMVSSTFIIDHIFKFHKYGFSWRNIEHTPELIEIHKTPELRNFITGIMQYLSQIHIEEIVSGLYTYKFPKKISMELNYLSKISEEAAATFNFTLDESFAVKHHYQEQIRMLELRYEKVYNGTSRDTYITSISGLHMILGDIYYYEEDLGNAILEYQDSIQFLRRKKVSKLSLYETITLIRNMLKLGLALEKRKSYDSAFATYGEVSSLVLRYREIKLKKLGLEYAINKNTNQDGFIKEYSKSKVDKRISTHIQPTTIEFEEDFMIEQNEFLETLRENLTPFKHEILFKITSFEGIRLFYQPLIAKFQIIEKNNLGGITQEDILRIQSEFEYVIKVINSDEKHLIKTEFFNKIGDILYYKNGLLNHKKYHSIYINKKYGCDALRNRCTSNGKKTPCVACEKYTESLHNMLDTFIKWNANSNEEEINICNPSLTAKPAPIHSFIEQYKDVKKNKIIRKKDVYIQSMDVVYIIELVLAIRNESFVSHRINSFKALAGLLSDIGDVRLSCASGTDKISDAFIANIELLITSIDNINKPEAGQNPKSNLLKSICAILFSPDYSRLDSALLYYLISSIYYKRAKELKNCAFQLNKMLQLFRENIRNEKTDKERLKALFIPPPDKPEEKTLMSRLVKKIFKSYYIAYEHVHLYQIEKFKSIFNDLDKDRLDREDISLKKLTIDTELEEVIYVAKNIELRYHAKDTKYLAKLFNMNLSSPYLNDNNMLNRTIRLQFKVRLNFAILSLYGLWNKEEKYCVKRLLDIVDPCYKFTDVDAFIKHCDPKLFPSENKAKELFEYLITDSIYSLNEILKSAEIYGQSYVLTHSYIGATHKKLHKWLVLYEVYTQLISENLMDIKNLTNYLNRYSKFLCSRFYLSFCPHGIYQPNNINNIGNNRQQICLIHKKNIHKRLSKIDDNQRKTLSHSIQNMMSAHDMKSLNLAFQAEKATHEYYAALETHREGKTYKNLIENMYYLNDDFNDKLFHFRLAQERYRINIGKVRTELNHLKNVTTDSDLYKLDSYLETMGRHCPDKG
ncbi:MAG: ATP-binding protein [Bacteroidales bacterium]|nr:ATP-binding protein [Bacteroidales bacterium]